MSICETCGAAVEPDAAFCSKCGASAPLVATGESVPPPPHQVEAGVPAATSSDSRNLGLLAHLSAFAMFVGVPSPVGPLVVWLIKRDQDPYVAAHALEALNFNLSLWLYGVAATVVAVLTLGLALIFIVPLGLVVGVAWFILVIIAALRASNGEHYRYPLTLRLIK
jgi:uncharacterized protein